MTQGIYLAGTEARNGKSVVVLAMMEHLIGHGRKVGFFRPVIRNEDDRDNLIHLVQNRYALEFSYEAMHGCETAKHALCWSSSSINKRRI